jgi:Holliday junction resolvase RusA-like endonuclease
MTPLLTVEVSGHPPSPNRRLCWQARRRLEQPYRDAISLQARSQYRGAPLERARVLVTFVYHSRRHVQDFDNLHARSKPLVDALRGIVTIDDSPRHVELVVRQQPGGVRAVRLEVWPLPQPATSAPSACLDSTVAPRRGQ